MTSTYLCTHHYLYPYVPEAKRPEPTPMISCGCGLNLYCPTCGFGWGSSPCNCAKPIQNTTTKETTKLIDNLTTSDWSSSALLRTVDGKVLGILDDIRINPIMTGLENSDLWKYIWERTQESRRNEQR